MKRIFAIFLATAFLLPTTLASHSATKATTKQQAEFSINSAFRCLKAAQQSFPSENLVLHGRSATIPRLANKDVCVAEAAEGVSKGETFGKVSPLDDVAAVALPFVPGGAGLALKGAKATKKVAEKVKKASKTKGAKKAKKGASKKKRSSKCPCKCFGEGTLVETEEGLIPIEEIEVGDKVLARSEDGLSTGYKPVVDLIRTPDNELGNLQLIDENNEVSVLSITPDHPVKTARAWVEAAKLKADELVSTGDGKLLWVYETWQPTGKEQTYNFEVSDFHTYFVSEDQAWVHNACNCGGDKPANHSPPGAKRRGAFREAKRKSNIPVSQQPSKVKPNIDKRGNKQPGRQYEFDKQGQQIE